MDLRLDDMTTLVTGASGGIGRALAEVFASEGARLVLHAHRHHAALESWLGAQPWRDRAVAVRADIRDPGAVATAVSEGEARFGRIDIAVANAGMWPTADLRLDQLSPERVRDTLDVNLLGATWTARAWMSSLARHGPRADGRGASLVFIGSTAGRFGEAGHADYAMSKAALRGLVASLKNEVVRLDPYARVNLVEPGWTVTRMAREALDAPGKITGVTRTMPLRQLARADDIARQVAILASPFASRHVSGEVVTVAGGMEGRVLWDASEIDEDAVRTRLLQE
jgi:3-oxoacyl-[acyl-carrier protein] reductase